MQTIVTKYLPATNTKGARIKASCEAGSVTISYPHEARRGHEAHAQAVSALACKMGWTEYLKGRVAGVEFHHGEWVFLPEPFIDWS